MIQMTRYIIYCGCNTTQYLFNVPIAYLIKGVLTDRIKKCHPLGITKSDARAF